jgi:hypothetical protein
VFQRDPDSLLEFVDNAAADDNNSVLSVMARLREHKPIVPFTVQWDGRALFELSQHDASKLKKMGGRPTTGSPDDLLAVLEGEMSSSEWEKAAKEHKGIGHTTFFKLKKELEEAGHVTREGQKYTNTKTS